MVLHPSEHWAKGVTFVICVIDILKQVRQLSGLAYIPTWQSPIANHRETQIVYNTGHHQPCGGLFFTAHMVCGCPAKFVTPG